MSNRRFGKATSRGARDRDAAHVDNRHSQQSKLPSCLKQTIWKYKYVFRPATVFEKIDRDTMQVTPVRFFQRTNGGPPEGEDVDCGVGDLPSICTSGIEGKELVTGDWTASNAEYERNRGTTLFDTPVWQSDTGGYISLPVCFREFVASDVEHDIVISRGSLQQLLRPTYSNSPFIRVHVDKSSANVRLFLTSARPRIPDEGDSQANGKRFELLLFQKDCTVDYRVIQDVTCYGSDRSCAPLRIQCSSEIDGMLRDQQAEVKWRWKKRGSGAKEHEQLLRLYWQCLLNGSSIALIGYSEKACGISDNPCRVGSIEEMTLDQIESRLLETFPLLSEKKKDLRISSSDSLRFCFHLFSSLRQFALGPSVQDGEDFLLCKRLVEGDTGWKPEPGFELCLFRIVI